MDTARVAAALGAADERRSVPILAFIPSVDRDGHDIDQGYWVEEAMSVLGQLYGGATALPAGRGSWWDHESRHLLHESIVVVFCLADGAAMTDISLLQRLGVFLRRMGLEARQGEVGIVIDSDYYGLREFEDDTESDH